MDKNRFIYMDALRIFSVFAVILMHVCSTDWYASSVFDSGWCVISIYDSAVRFCVPVFVMISGALFLNPEKEISISTLYKKNILRVVTAFLFWSLLYSILQAAFFHKKNNLLWNRESVLSVIRAFAEGHYHLWFVFMIIGLYMSVPFLRSFAHNKKLLEYYLILAFVFSFGLTIIRTNPDTFSTVTATVLTKIKPCIVTEYLAYFVFGYYLHTYGLQKKGRIAVYILGIVSIGLTAFLTVFVSRMNAEAKSVYYGEFMPMTLFTSAAVFLAFKQIFSCVTWQKKTENRIRAVSETTFGIYLLHDIFNMILNQFDYHVVNHHPAVMIPVLTVAIFLYSFLLVFFLRKIPFFRKYLS